jgi:hypothetical protein
VASAIVISGHTVLNQAALENAQFPQFEIRNCFGLVKNEFLKVRLALTIQNPFPWAIESFSYRKDALPCGLPFSRFHVEG